MLAQTNALPPAAARPKSQKNSFLAWYLSLTPYWMGPTPGTKCRLLLRTHQWIVDRVLEPGAGLACALDDVRPDGPLQRILADLVPADDAAEWQHFITLIVAHLRHALRLPVTRRNEAWLRWLFLIPYSIRETPAGGKAMLRGVSELQGFSVAGTDGEVGRVLDVHLDPAGWAVRAVEVDTGRRALLSPRLLGPADATRRVVAADLTRAQIAAGPCVGTDRSAVSARDLVHDFVLGLDEEIGRVTEVLVDDRRWTMRYLVVTPDGDAPAHRVLVPAGWIAWVCPHARAVMLALHGRSVRYAPPYDEAGGLEAMDEAQLAAYYGRAPFAAA